MIKKKSIFSKDNILIFILIIALIAGAFASPTFLKLNNIKNILFSCCVYGILAVGQACVMITKEIDLSIGAMIAFLPTLSIQIIDRLTKLAQGKSIIVGGNYVMTNWMLIVLLTMAGGILMGMVTGLIVVKLKVPSLIVTLGMMTALSGLVYVLSGGYDLYLTNMEGVNWVGTKAAGNVIPVNFIIFLSIGIVIAVLMKYTKFGMRMYSTGGKEKAAAISGINTGRWKIIAFMISGLCAGIAAIIYCSRMETVGASQGSGYEMTAIAMAVVGGVTLEGGKGTIMGTVLSTVLLTVVLNIQQLLGLVSWYQNLTIGIIIVFAALLHNYKGKRFKTTLQTTT